MNGGAPATNNLIDDSAFTFTVYNAGQRPVIPTGIPITKAVRDEITDTLKKTTNPFCGQGMDDIYLVDTLETGQVIGVGRIHTVIVALIVLYDHTHVHPSEKRPVCKDYELYLDAVCAHPAYHGVGCRALSMMFNAIYNAGFQAVRIYSVYDALTYWRDRWGFEECDTIKESDGKVWYLTAQRKSYEYERRRRLNPSRDGATLASGPAVNLSDDTHYPTYIIFLRDHDGRRKKKVGYPIMGLVPSKTGGAPQRSSWFQPGRHGLQFDDTIISAKWARDVLSAESASRRREDAIRM